MAASTGGDTEGDPGIRTMRDVILSPAVRDADARVRFAFGAHDAAGRYLDAFLLVRVYGTSARPAVPAGPPERHVGEAIYAGPLLPQFGHFLLESLARLWALRDAPAGLPILWHVVDPRLRPWQRDIFAMVGLDPRRFVMIDRVTTVGRLLVPDPGFRIRLDCHPRQMAALAAVPARPLDPAKRVWLSRSRLPPAKVGVEEEALLEDRLRAGGWTIFHPETASIGAQVDMLADAAVIAGFEGSAFHCFVLFDCRSRVVIFQRYERLNENYALIAEGKGIPQESHFLALPPDPASPHRYRMDAAAMARVLATLGGAG